jgi:hypothetical protein
MDNIDLIAAVVVIGLVVLGLLAWVGAQRRRSEALRRQFGPEYEQALAAAGSRRAAEDELAARRKRVAALDIQALPEPERQRYARAWRAAQTRFVDEPAPAVIEADRLVNEVMRARGYPMGDFEQRAADLSVDHGNVVTHYRAARELAETNSAGRASTEALRQAMIHYRALFEDLLADAREPDHKELAL